MCSALISDDICHHRHVIGWSDRRINVYSGAVDGAVVGGEGEGRQIGAGIDQCQTGDGEQNFAGFSAGAKDVVCGVGEGDGDRVAFRVTGGEGGNNRADGIAGGVFCEGGGAEQRKAGNTVRWKRVHRQGDGVIRIGAIVVGVASGIREGGGSHGDHAIGGAVGGGREGRRVGGTGASEVGEGAASGADVVRGEVCRGFRKGESERCRLTIFKGADVAGDGNRRVVGINGDRVVSRSR